MVDYLPHSPPKCVYCMKLRISRIEASPGGVVIRGMKIYVPTTIFSHCYFHPHLPPLDLPSSKRVPLLKIGPGLLNVYGCLFKNVLKPSCKYGAADCFASKQASSLQIASRRCRCSRKKSSAHFGKKTFARGAHTAGTHMASMNWGLAVQVSRDRLQYAWIGSAGDAVGGVAAMYMKMLRMVGRSDEDGRSGEDGRIRQRSHRHVHRKQRCGNFALQHLMSHHNLRQR